MMVVVVCGGDNAHGDRDYDGRVVVRSSLMIK